MVNIKNHPDMDRISSLDGMRGLAACMVVASHVSNATGLWNYILGVGGGQVGVTLFFVLSGFLMGRIYLERPFSSAAVLEYVAHRVGRVLPLFYAVVTAALLFNLYVIDSLKQTLFHYGLILGASVLWTIPVEVHFYVLFIGLWWLHHRSPWLMVLIVTLIMGAYWVLPIYPSAEYRILPYYLVFFLTGILISLIVSPGWVKKTSTWTWWIAPLALLPFLLYPNIYSIFFEVSGWLAHPAQYQQMWHDPRYTIAAGAFLITTLLSVPVRFILSLPPLRFLGRISYSMYLLHLPIMEFVLPRIPQQLPPIISLFIVFGVTIAASWLTFRLIERPCGIMIRNRIRPQVLSRSPAQ